MASGGETHSIAGSLPSACTARKITNTCLTWGRHQIETFTALLALCTSNSPKKGQWREALMFSLICFSTSSWVSNRDAGDLRRNCPHYDVNVMYHRGNVLCLCQGLFLLRFLHPVSLSRFISFAISSSCVSVKVYFFCDFFILCLCQGLFLLRFLHPVSLSRFISFAISSSCVSVKVYFFCDFFILCLCQGLFLLRFLHPVSLSRFISFAISSACSTDNFKPNRWL